MNYENQFKVYFHDLIKKYALTLKVVSDNKIWLIGKNFILTFLFHFDDINLSIIKKDSCENLQKWDIDNYVSSLLDADDRKEIQQGNSIADIIENIIIVLSVGLENHCFNLLSGKENWLDDYQKSKYARKPQVLSMQESTLAKKFI